MSCGNVDIQENYLEIVERHKKSNRTELKKMVKKYWDENPEVTAYSNKNYISGIFNKRYREVIREYNKMRGLVRFSEVFPEMILFARNIGLEHRIGDLLANHFGKRYPQFCVVISSLKKAYIGSWRRDLTFPYKKSKRYPVWIKKFSEADDFIGEFRLLIQEQSQERIELFEFSDKEFHESYYDLQYISERKNLKHAQSMLPYKYIKKANLKHEEVFFLKEKMNFKGKKNIDEYF